MGSLYNKVKVNNPGHSFFNLSNDKKFDCDMGQLIPIKTLFCMPNDVIKFGNEIVARMNPLVAPVMHEINIYTQYFFVPLRIMFGQMKTHTYPSPSGTVSVSEWDVNDRDFETFLTGGKTGYDTSVSLPFLDRMYMDSRILNDNYVHKIEWDSVNSEYTNAIKISSGDIIPDGVFVYRSGSSDLWGNTFSDGSTQAFDVWIPLYQNEVTFGFGKYSLADYLEFPVLQPFPQDINVSAFPQRAYNLIWNNFFRDQNLMDEIDVVHADVVKNVCWAKDYFTAAYTELQRGQAPALPGAAILPVVVDPNSSVSDLGQLGSFDGALGRQSNVTAGSFFNYSGSSVSPTTKLPVVANATGMFNVNDLRVAFRVQEWLEVNLRVGEHLNEFLIGHFGIGPHDETLQRPVYLGGSKSPVIVSEVLQTSQTTDDTATQKGSPQGNLAGHGISADRNYIGSYRCKEFGVFMGLMYIRPKGSYQQGLNREWLYETKYDLPFPEFTHLGNQPIFESEIFTKSTGNVDVNGNPVIFGYTERYNELRSSHSVVCGGMRDTFDFWHLGRKFDSAPNYNADFVRCVPSKRIFAVESEPGFIVNVGNIVHAYRPIPIYGEPRT